LANFVRSQRSTKTTGAGTVTPDTVNQALRSIGQLKQGRRFAESWDHVVELHETALKGASFYRADLKRAAL
jgi:hypothetical protein